MNAELKHDRLMATADDMLREDPVRCYGSMDQPSQERYLRVVTQLAARSGAAPLAVATEVLRLAAAAHADACAARRAHVGYYLIAEGRFELMAALGIDLNLRERLQRSSDLIRLSVYLATIGFLSLSATATWLIATPLQLPFWAIAAAAAVAFVGATHLGVQWTNQCMRLLFPPERLARFNFSRGVPDAFRTLIAVPCMLTSPKAIDELICELESLGIGNADRNIGYCLVTDFLDSDCETEDGDVVLLDTAVAGIEALNRRHDGGFVLMHRRRVWNPQEGKWMGWERKRGKLEDLNAALVGDDRVSRFACVSGDATRLDGVRFVITLDDDMGLQRGDARRMIATLAHPVNLPVLAEDSMRVERGFGLLQPSLYAVPRRERPTRYERLYGTVVVSADDSGVKANVYQDLFEQASYCGKGIYDVRAFYKVLHRRFPENLVLSHDMLEGAFIRSGLVSDISMAEEFPATYLANIQRRHRWLRGDWQTVPWLLPWVRDAGGRRIVNRISSLGYWLTIDNVRRILAPIAQLVALIIGIGYSTRPVLWAAAAMCITVLPVLSSLCLHIWLNGRKTSLALVRSLAYKWFTATLLNMAFIVYESKIGLDAILRSSYRMLASRRRLLEWIPQSIVNQQADAGLGTYYRSMWLSPAFAAALYAVVAAARPSALPAALPFVSLWLLSPTIAWWLSRSAPQEV